MSWLFVNSHERAWALCSHRSTWFSAAMGNANSPVLWYLPTISTQNWCSKSKCKLLLSTGEWVLWTLFDPKSSQLMALSWSHIPCPHRECWSTWIQSSFGVSLSYLSPRYSSATTPPCSTTPSEFMIVSLLGSKGLLHVPDSLMPVWKMGKTRTWSEESFVELLPDMFTFSCLDASIFLLL